MLNHGKSAAFLNYKVRNKKEVAQLGQGSVASGPSFTTNSDYRIKDEEQPVPMQYAEPLQPEPV